MTNQLILTTAQRDGFIQALMGDGDTEVAIAMLQSLPMVSGEPVAYHQKRLGTNKHWMYGAHEINQFISGATGESANWHGAKPVKDFVSDLRSQLEAAKNQWQPIETAPKDGSWIRLCGGGIHYGWDGSDEPPIVTAQYTTERNGGEIDGHWQFAWYDGGYYGEYEDPTHWMPLPAPPAIQAEGTQA